METTICPNCKTVTIEKPEKCKTCSYPLFGTKEEQGRFIGRKIRMKHTLVETQRLVRISRLIIIVWAGMDILAIFAPADGNHLVFIIPALLFSGTLFLSVRKPFWGIFIALALYFLDLIAFFIYTPDQAMHGLGWKLTTIGILGYTLFNLRKIERYNGENSFREGS